MINNIFINIVKSIYLVLILFSYLFYTQDTIYAYFTEDFNSGFSSNSSWNIINGQGISFTETGIALNEVTPFDFPYIYSKDPIIGSDDETIEIRFNYINSGSNFGDGIAITDQNPLPGTVMLYPETFSTYSMFYIWQGPGYPYLHIVTFLCPIDNPECNGEPTILYQTSSQDYGSHVINILKKDDKYTFFVDDVKYFESSKASRVAKNIWIGHPERTSNPGSWASLFIDYIHISNGPPTTSPSPSPTATPTLSPTPSPTPSQTPSPSTSPSPSPTLPPTSPSPTPIPSRFPYYSQSDKKWAKDVYDHAQSWAQRGKIGIDRWGCALSSASMVLKNYAIRSKQGLETTPSTLNNWLRSQPDGYIGNGLINWLAITRYVHESKLAGKSPTELEFVKSKYLQASVEDELSSGKYPILGTPGHFVIATAASDHSYSINDPADKTKLTLSKSENILTSNTFYPSMTDLSYILMSYDPTMSVKLIDSTGESIEGLETEEYLSDDISGQNTKTLKLFYAPKPKSDDYTIETTNQNNQKSKLTIYAYNKSGQVWRKSIEVYPDISTKFNFKYDNEKIIKNRINHNWKWVWQYIRKWRRWEPIWDSKIRWSIKDN